MEGRLRVRLIQFELPLDCALSSCMASSSLFCDCENGVDKVFSVSSFTPTIASEPSLKLTWAEPLVSGRIPVSALNGRKSVEERESGRMGGCEDSDVCR